MPSPGPIGRPAAPGQSAGGAAPQPAPMGPAYEAASGAVATPPVSSASPAALPVQRAVTPTPSVPLGRPTEGRAPGAASPQAPFPSVLAGPGSGPAHMGQRPTEGAPAAVQRAAASPAAPQPPVHAHSLAYPSTPLPPTTASRTSPTVQRDAAATPAPTPTAPAPTPPPAATSRTARTSSQTRDSGTQTKRTTTSTATQTAGFDARSLTEGQFDELVHRLIGPLTRLLRTEFRLDRERIGKLRDPRR